jgi:hypothetical protein
LVSHCWDQRAFPARRAGSRWLRRAGRSRWRSPSTAEVGDVSATSAVSDSVTSSHALICAMPRALLRSVLLICTFSTACMCRVSTQTTGNSTPARALKRSTQKIFSYPQAVDRLAHLSSGHHATDVPANSLKRMLEVRSRDAATARLPRERTGRPYRIRAGGPPMLLVGRTRRARDVDARPVGNAMRTQAYASGSPASAVPARLQ